MYQNVHTEIQKKIRQTMTDGQKDREIVELSL